MASEQALYDAALEEATQGILQRILMYGTVGAFCFVMGWLYMHQTDNVPAAMKALQISLKNSTIMRWIFDKPEVPAALDGAGKEEAVRPSALLYLGCFLGLQTAYLSWGYFQERIMTRPYGDNQDRFTTSEFLVFLNRLMAMFFAMFVMSRQAKPTTSAPRFAYAVTSLSNVLSSWFQYEALRFVPFPLQVLSKSSKILFSMLVGKCLNGKEQTYQQYFLAVMIAVGILVYKVNEVVPSHKERSLESQGEGAITVGVMMLGGYVLCDAFTAQWQGRQFKQHNLTPVQIMLGVNVCSSVLTFAMLLGGGQFFPCVDFMLTHPTFAVHAGLMSVCSALGQLCIFFTIKTFGPVAFATIMTARQAFSILLSCINFGHAISPGGYLGLTIVFTCLALRTYLASRAKK